MVVAQSVAELTIGLIISAARMIPLHDRLVKEGKWPKGVFQGVELKGETLGIIGLGNVGMRVAKIAKAIGMDIIAYDARDLSPTACQLGIRFVKNMDELLRESDVIPIHVPLTKDTYHLIDERAFRLMKSGVIIVNTSRGAAIDSKALLRALKEGKVRAAALDVLENEPPRHPWEIKIIKDSRAIMLTIHLDFQDENLSHYQ